MVKLPDYPILTFKTQKEFHNWLDKNNQLQGIWLRLFKKNSGKKSVSYAEAVDEALCYGWIDSLVKKYDEDSYIQKFTPRRSKSVWSKINVGNIERLTKEGRMQPLGITQVEAAKKDGRWTKAYESPANLKVPEDFVAELNKFPKAKSFFFEKLNKTNKFLIVYQLHSAKKPETRERRMKKFIEMLEKREKLY